MCLTSSCSSSNICYALVSNVSFFSLVSCECSPPGILLYLPLSISIILCFLALAAASYCSFCSSSNFRYWLYCSFVEIFVDCFILSISLFVITTASDFYPFSVLSLMSLNSSFETTIGLFSLLTPFPFLFPIRYLLAFWWFFWDEIWN
jgi:hypothetical protein